MQVTCVKGRPKLIGKGVYRLVFRVGNIVLKVERSKERDPEKLQKRAIEVDSHQRTIREELTFLPAYYGTVLTGVRRDGDIIPAVVTFHEYVRPLPAPSIETLRDMFSLIGKAGEKGYVLDIKFSNFGKKRGKVFYLDEYGIGKGPIPPDVLEDLNKFVQFVFKRIKLRKPA